MVYNYWCDASTFQVDGQIDMRYSTFDVYSIYSKGRPRHVESKHVRWCCFVNLYLISPELEGANRRHNLPHITTSSLAKNSGTDSQEVLRTGCRNSTKCMQHMLYCQPNKAYEYCTSACNSSNAKQLQFAIPSHMIAKIRLPKRLHLDPGYTTGCSKQKPS